MPGTIRFFVGLIMVMGAVGGLEAKPDAAIGTILLWAAVGLAVMQNGVQAMNRKSV